MMTDRSPSITTFQKGKDGETWEPYINDDGKWHIRLKDKGEDA